MGGQLFLFMMEADLLVKMAFIIRMELIIYLRSDTHA